MENVPYVPPAPPKKRRVWPWVVGVILVIAAINGASQVNETESEPVEFSSVEDSGFTANEDMLIARAVWDSGAVSQADKDAICDVYLTPPVGVTSEMVRVFAEGAEMSYDDAERVLDQLLAEEC